MSRKTIYGIMIDAPKSGGHENCYEKPLEFNESFAALKWVDQMASIGIRTRLLVEVIVTTEVKYRYD